MFPLSIHHPDKVRIYLVSVVCNPFPHEIDTLTFYTVLLKATCALAHIGVLFYIQTFTPNKFLAPLPRKMCFLLILIPNSPSLLWIFLLFFLFSCLCISFYLCFIFFEIFLVFVL